VNLSLDVVTPAQLFQLLVAVANIIIAAVMYLSVREIRKDRRRAFLEKRLEEFYIPLIDLFGREGLTRDSRIYNKVEEILFSKRYLCGKELAGKLPQRFTANKAVANNAFLDEIFYFLFNSEEEVKYWEEVADTLWNEYIKVLEEYYRLIGVKQYVLPEKPRKWMFARIRPKERIY